MQLHILLRTCHSVLHRLTCFCSLGLLGEQRQGDSPLKQVSPVPAATLLPLPSCLRRSPKPWQAGVGSNPPALENGVGRQCCSLPPQRHNFSAGEAEQRCHTGGPLNSSLQVASYPSRSLPPRLSCPTPCSWPCRRGVQFRLRCMGLVAALFP